MLRSVSLRHWNWFCPEHLFDARYQARGFRLRELSSAESIMKGAQPPVFKQRHDDDDDRCRYRLRVFCSFRYRLTTLKKRGLHSTNSKGSGWRSEIRMKLKHG
nr:hypothetical protein CFP56_68682 [Quercus suber]